MNLLTLITFLPLAGALAVALLPIKKERNLRFLTLGITLVVALLGLVVWQGFDDAVGSVQMQSKAHWFTLPSGTAVHYLLGIDGLSVMMVVFTVILMPIVVLSAAGHVHTRVREFLVWLLVMETGMLGTFLALDIVFFYFFWEVSLVPLYFILGIWGGERRLYATLKFFLYTLAGSLVMLVAAIALIYQSGTSDVQAATTWAMAQPLSTQLWLFAGFALAFAIKVPLLPFHTWLPDAHTEAPTSGSVILAGVLLKMGTYGLLRFGVAMFPAASIKAAPIFLVLGALGIVYGAFLAMAQTDMKRLIACSSVSHLGYVVLGLFALTEAGIQGGLLQMVNHGLSTGLLFLLFGMLYERRHTRALDQYGGIATKMPIFAFLFVLAMLSSVGLPGLNGFVGEWLILLGAFQAKPWIAAVAVTGVIFGAVYLLSATRRLLFGPLVHPENEHLADLKRGEVALMLPLFLLCVWIGIAPRSFQAKSSASVDLVLERLDRARTTLKTGQTSPPHLEGEDFAVGGVR